MFQVSIQSNTQVWPFLFKDKERAEAARDTALAFTGVNSHTMGAQPGVHCELTDDFGRTGKFCSVAAVVFENLDESMYANIALAIHQQHTQLKFNQQAKNDPLIMASQRGPGVISPMMANGAGFGRN